MKNLKINFFVLTTVCFMTMVIPCSVMGESNERGIIRTGSDDVSIRIGGTLQPRATIATDGDSERVGFGLRRLRMRVHSDIGDRIGVFLQLEGAGASTTWVDVAGEYYISDELTLRVGRLIGAQPRAMARTGHANIDAIDFAAIAELWAGMTVGADSRDYGIEALWSTNEWEFSGFLHNGYNQWNFRSGITSEPVTGGRVTDGVAFSAAATHWPSGNQNELELGVHAGVNLSENELTRIAGVGRQFFTYSAHAYWGRLPGSQPYRFKADIIGISYQEVEPFGAYHYLGGSVLGSYLVIPHLELFARGEVWYSDEGTSGSFSRLFATTGGSFSISALNDRPFQLNRIIFAWSLKTGEADSFDFDNLSNVFIVQAQILF